MTATICAVCGFSFTLRALTICPGSTNRHDVQVRFRTGELEKAYKQQKIRVRLWGVEVAKRYVNRVDLLKAAKSKDDLFTLPQLRFHPLKGKRQGQYAMTLLGRMRLIVTFDEQANTATVVAEEHAAGAEKATVEEVSKHYDD